MKLFYSPGACSLSPHIVLREGGFDVALERVDLKQGTTESGLDFRTVNPAGYVPALQLDDGAVLTEGAVIVQYLADHAPDAGLAPPVGTMPRYRLMEWLNFISTELHKGFGPLFNPAMPEDGKAVARARLEQRIADAERRLGDNDYAMGDAFSIADAYFFTVLGWCRMVGVDLATWPSLVAYRDRVAARPAVQAALEAEGLVAAKT